MSIDLPTERPDEPLWYKDAVIYQLHVKAYADSDGNGIGDFDGLTSRLDYLKDLGVSAIWLLPFYPSPLRDDGYDISDYNGVHASYGDLAAFRRFLKAAHHRGIRVITELVINHTSDEHHWFQRARRAPVGSPARDFYVWSDTTDGYGEARIIFQDFETSNWAWDTVAGQYYWHRFYTHQPDLNFENPAVHRELFRVLDRWFKAGVDGVRLDAVPYLYEREGSNCENLPETHAFLKKLRAHVDERYGDRMLLAEANQWPEDAVAYFGEGDGDECHMAFHFPVMPRLYMALQMEDRRPIIDILDQTPSVPSTAQWAMFLRNHDELTLEMVTDEERDYMVRAYARDPQMRINLGIRRRLAPLLQNDRRKIELLNALLFSLPGTPIVYYGDEIGMGDNVYLGDRDAVRTPMQWSSDRNAGFSRANPQQLYLPVIIDPAYHYETVNAEAQRANPSSLWWWMHRIIALRNRHQVFGRGDLEFLHPENAKVLAYLRTPAPGAEGDQILVVANLSRNAQAVELDLSAHDGATPIELFGHTRFAPIGELPYYLTLAPYGYYWFRLESSAPPAHAATPPEHAPVVSVPPGSGLLDGRAAPQLERALARWLTTRRWFGAKSRPVLSIRVSDAVEVRDGRAGPRTQILLVTVELAEGDNETYSVPVATVPATDADEMGLPANAVIARIDQGPTRPELILYDGLADPPTARRFLDLVRSRRSQRGRRGELRGWSTAALRAGLGGEQLPVAPVGGEQSNTSLTVGELAMVKWYRRVDDGESPEVELGRHLDGVGFEHSARVLGGLEYRPPVGEVQTLAVVHERIPGDGDAWAYALDGLDRFFEQVAASPEDPDRFRTPGDPFTSIAAVPADMVYELIGPFLGSVELLGQRTAELHIALAAGGGPSFVPEAFSTLYQRSLYQAISADVRVALATLRAKRGRLSEELRDALAAIAWAPIEARLHGLRGRRIPAQRIRVHGDYHLGQVLWDGRDFAIIDFEGEPARPIGERRIKRSPLRDVAGMLRSFDYAGQVGLRTQVERGAFDDLEDAARALGQWRARWTEWVSRQYLMGYLATISPALVPGDAHDVQLLLDVFLLQKICYEVRYELDHRPDWLAIPLTALAELVAGFAEPEASGP